MKRGEDSDSIPNDLVLEILSRLPAKSTGRFRCVSKLWGSMLDKPYFTELFLTRSSARPRLLIGIYLSGELLFFSVPQPQNPYEKSSIVVRADFHMKYSRNTGREGCRYAAGLVFFTSLYTSNKYNDAKRVICNPIMRQSLILPKLRLTYRSSLHMLGFDPIGKQYKVLSMDNKLDDEKVHYILTLGTEELRWRKIQCSLSPEVWGVGISISGVLYYLAQEKLDGRYVICCFDVRSEKFRSLNLNPFCSYQGSTLINYKGKLGVINLRYETNQGGFPIHLRMCVLEDFEKQEWSTYVYTLKPDDDEVLMRVKYYFVSVVGMTSRGELVLEKMKACKPFYIFYFNLERNTLLSVEIRGVGEDHKWFENHRVWAFVDHVEDLQFNIMKKPSRSPT